MVNVKHSGGRILHQNHIHTHTLCMELQPISRTSEGKVLSRQRANMVPVVYVRRRSTTINLG